jgi:ATP-binding cassette subfamily B protein
MRYHELTRGSIYIDGRDIAAYPRTEVRKSMGMVLQDTWLTGGTIEENIAYGKIGATHEEVKAAAKAAQAHSFIRALPDGYNMEINEEANNISQGQKQLLTIARTVLADNRILILDEATSSVDTRTEILIQKAMDTLMEGRTSFIIAHRLSTIRNADLILCLDHGDIVEQGTHDELLEKGGFYAKLYQSQFQAIA